MKKTKKILLGAAMGIMVAWTAFVAVAFVIGEGPDVWDYIQVIIRKLSAIARDVFELGCYGLPTGLGARYIYRKYFKKSSKKVEG